MKQAMTKQGGMWRKNAWVNAFVNEEFDELEVPDAGAEFERDLRPRVPSCSCAQANLAAGKRPHTRTFSPIRQKADGTCPYCGYYTALMVTGGGK